MTSLGRSRKGDIKKLREALDALSLKEESWGISPENAELAGIIDEALGFPAPEGSPDTIEDKARSYARAARHADEVRADVEAVAKAGLPSTWVGEAGSKASEVTKAAGRNAEQMAEKFGKAATELSLLAQGIAQAQSRHSHGMDALHDARAQLGDNVLMVPGPYAVKARSIARGGLGSLESGVEAAEAAGERAERELDKLTSEARAGQLDSRHLSDADRVVLADAGAHGGDPDENEILSTTDLQRSGMFLDRMSAEDRAAYDKLLDGSKSPQERAYLMKALAAGYSLEEIQDFSASIRPYGDDPAWLQQHLTPIVNRSDDERRYGDQSHEVAFGGQVWEQEGNTCVALSTVTMHAQSDPLYALELTTGGRPGDPEYDSPEAFEERLRDEETRVYDTREGKKEGMSGEESEQVADDEIGRHTGADYEQVSVDSVAKREDALPEIRDSVNSGRPVAFGAREGTAFGHQMMIIGQEGDKLQIYNPWGFTTWVSEEDFVNGTMSGASSEDYPTPTDIRIPQ
ncbi:peptidoglycan-binding protein [Streptomyces sp. NPDC054796]